MTVGANGFHFTDQHREPHIFATTFIAIAKLMGLIHQFNYITAQNNFENLELPPHALVKEWQLLQRFERQHTPSQLTDIASQAASSQQASN